MQRWARSAGAERQDGRLPSQYLKLARGAKECHHVRCLCDGNQTKFCLSQGLRPWSQHWVEKESEEASRARMLIRFEHYTNLCQRYISRFFFSAARRDFDESVRERSWFSNVEVHVLMSDATKEDSVEKSKVTVGFVWSIGASGDAIQRFDDAEGELQAEQQSSCTDLQDVHTGTAVETLKIFERQLQPVSCPTWREDAPARTHRIFVVASSAAR